MEVAKLSTWGNGAILHNFQGEFGDFASFNHKLKEKPRNPKIPGRIS
jgi:hypothetical protein